MKIPNKKDLPKSIMVNGEEYRIVFVEKIDGTDPYGICDPENRVISIKTKETKKETFKTFIHEVLHAIENEYDIEIPHKLVHDLELPIYNFLKDNDFFVEKN